MATDLVSTISQSFSPDIIGKLASSLGLEQSATQKGVSAAIPGILAGLANTASVYDGTHKISRAISQVDNLTARSGDTLKNLLDSSKSAVGSGWNIGSSVLGSSTLETLSSQVAKYAGFDLGSAQKLLSFLVPVVFGFLKREQARGNLNNFGLAKLLVSQKSNIERAIPAGFTQAAYEVESRPRVSQGKPADTGRPSYQSASAGKAGGQDWGRWLLPALVVGAAAFFLLQNREETNTAQRTVIEAQQPPAKERAQITAATLENEIVASIERLRVALPKVSDPASAPAAVNEIREISSRFAQLKSASQQLSAEVRKPIWDAFSARVSELNSSLDQIIKQIKFLSEEAKPAIDTIKTELANLSKA